ncbi:homoserine dehydrogenase [Fictibacillus aquaticus]|uniref:Homoserine dehydrogenase n=1 Tax=Fictibacillus aquaticus TaxID=2021314 RepID=A0A235FE09_9BACL|nr:homoserine dehydrogenase [Fictibacillus aquaticus]OYD59551.1 homoserine dehydrogenase [Fictibacillus aquaticus]
MTVIKAALLGFGTVGQGVYEAVQTHGEQLKELFGAELSIEAILVKDLSKHRNGVPETLLTDDFEHIISIPDLQVVFEAIVGEEPGLSYLKRSIQSGCHVITANKVMFARHGASLLKEAEEAGVSVGFEATTAGGAPVIRTISELLKVNRIQSVEGILNGTSNFILSVMREQGLSFEQALELAQQKGYAEADPSADVEGFDAYNKLMILSQLAFGEQPDWKIEDVEGISSITPEQVTEASNRGFRFKHIVRAEQTEQGITASVKPVLLTEEHPLYSVEGVINAVTVSASLAGLVTVQGAGAGKLPTASAMVEDAAALAGKLNLNSTVQSQYA